MGHWLLAIAVFSACWMGVGIAHAQQPSVHDWSGIYVGGGVGGVEGESKTTMTVASTAGYFTGTDPAQIAALGAGDLTQWHPSGGIEAGYGRQFGNVLVGIEASANSLSFNDERTLSADVQSTPGTHFYIKQSVTADWQATVRPRLGWAQDNWLAFVTGGLALTQLKMDSTYRDDSVGSGFSHSSVSKISLGWTLGVGGEYALNRNWSLRGDYLYADFGSVDSTSAVSETTGGTPYLDHSADLRTHTVLVGLTYRFDGF